jgi:hypothetical protein
MMGGKVQVRNTKNHKPINHIAKVLKTEELFSFIQIICRAAEACLISGFIVAILKEYQIKKVGRKLLAYV